MTGRLDAEPGERVERSPPDHKRDEAVLSRVWSFGLLTLLGVTFPLWLSAWQHDGYPVVPWISIPWRHALDDSRQIIDCVGLTSLVASLAWITLRGPSRWAWGTVVVSLSALLLMDQHRLQPWAYQSLVYAFALATLPWSRARPFLIAVAISIYAYSSAGKLDYQFTHTVGAEMFQLLASPFAELSIDQASKFALTLPLGELALAVLLTIPRTRRLGGWFAIGLHVSLIAMLGPFGMNHSLGVLCWNALLAAQAFLLFGRRARHRVSPEQRDSITRSLRTALPAAVMWVPLVMPLFERVGYWDHWTSWALYSPHNSRISAEFHEVVLGQLPESLQEHLSDNDGDRWYVADIDQWSLQSRRVPVYPQARYQLSLLSEVVEAFESDEGVRVTVQSVSDRFDGTREQQPLIGRQSLKEQLSRFWFVPSYKTDPEKS